MEKKDILISLIVAVVCCLATVTQNVKFGVLFFTWAGAASMLVFHWVRNRRIAMH